MVPNKLWKNQLKFSLPTAKKWGMTLDNSKYTVYLETKQMKICILQFVIITGSMCMI